MFRITFHNAKISKYVDFSLHLCFLEKDLGDISYNVIYELSSIQLEGNEEEEFLFAIN